MALVATNTVVQRQGGTPKEQSKVPLVFVLPLSNKDLPLRRQGSIRLWAKAEALKIQVQLELHYRRY